MKKRVELALAKTDNENPKRGDLYLHKGRVRSVDYVAIFKNDSIQFLAHSEEGTIPSKYFIKCSVEPILISNEAIEEGDLAYDIETQKTFTSTEENTSLHTSRKVVIPSGLIGWIEVKEGNRIPELSIYVDDESMHYNSFGKDAVNTILDQSGKCYIEMDGKDAVLMNDGRVAVYLE